jgi:flagellin-like hook-associated protein FlgL
MSSMRVTQSMMVNTSLNNLNYQTRRLLQLQEQLATGLRVNSPSDDPLAARTAINIWQTMSREDQYLGNISGANLTLLESVTAIQSVVDSLGRATEITLEGANGTMAQSQRNQLAVEANQILESVLMEANHQTNGRYVFGGTPPYTVTTNFPGAVSVSGSPVLRSGGGFTITTNGTCFTNMTIIVADATGRVLETAPTASNVFGTAEPPPPPLVLTPSSLSGTCSAGSTFTFLATGGTGTYSAAVNAEAGATGDTPTVTAPGGSSSSASTGGTITVSFRSAIAGGVGATGVFDITVSSGTQIKTLKLTCS